VYAIAQSRAIRHRFQGRDEVTLFGLGIHLDRDYTVNLKVIIVTRCIQFGPKVVDQVGVGNGFKRGGVVVGFEGGKDLLGAVNEIQHIGRVFAGMRLLKQFKQAQESLRNALAKSDEKAVDDAKGQMNALILFKADMGAFQRMYSFLSQIFDYGNTGIEKRFIFYRRLSPLLEFGRERQLPLGDGEAPRLTPISSLRVGLPLKRLAAIWAAPFASLGDA
jgi:hypothetical protein